MYNLADCVKQYDKHESETVTTAITAVSEAYPELKSNENYKQLMNELAMTENLIAKYRSIVNDIKNFVFGPAKAPVYGFGRNRKQKFVMSFTIIIIKRSKSTTDMFASFQ